VSDRTKNREIESYQGPNSYNLMTFQDPNSYGQFRMKLFPTRKSDHSFALIGQRVRETIDFVF
jgi:hypothetical protein